MSDGSLIPCILIENKTDLVLEDEIKDDIKIKEFTKINNFLEVFRSSAKQGININESMDYLISKIVSNQESIVRTSDCIVSETNKRSIVLDDKRIINNNKKTKTKCCWNKKIIRIIYL